MTPTARIVLSSSGVFHRLQQLHRCIGLPFDAHSSECEDRADDGDVLHVVHGLAETGAKRPAEREPLGRLKNENSTLRTQF